MKYKDIRIKIPYQVEYIISELQSNGYDAYIVGGSVRDSILHRKVHDYDIATNAFPESVSDIFTFNGDKVVPTGIKHGTVTVMVKSDGFEITTFRKDGNYLDSRKPDSVEFINSLKEDLSRRDFTINAMAYNSKEGLIDYFNGLEDLQNKTIKCVGNANKRFTEDNLRRLRAIRFASQLNFQIEDNTYEALSYNSHRITLLSKERIRDELCKILLSENVIYGIRELWNLDMLKYIIPELEACVGFNQYNTHHDKDVFDHILSVTKNTPTILELRLAALLHDIGKPKCFSLGENGQGHFIGHHKISADMAREILKSLKFDNKTIDNVCLLVYEHMISIQMKKQGIKKLINRVGKENIDDLIVLCIADRKGMAQSYQNYDDILVLKNEIDKILNNNEPFSLKDLCITGRDLINLGYEQGRTIGKILNWLLEKVIENPNLNDKKTLINLILKFNNIK